MEQATEGYSISVQKEKLQKYAEAQSYEVVGIYSDEGFSGKDLMRPEMDKLINDVKANKIDVVLIYKLDRLSRHVKDVLELVELFDKYKVALYSLNENLDLSSPFGRAALKMSATFSRTGTRNDRRAYGNGQARPRPQRKIFLPGQSAVRRPVTQSRGQLGNRTRSGGRRTSYVRQIHRRVFFP